MILEFLSQDQDFSKALSKKEELEKLVCEGESCLSSIASSDSKLKEAIDSEDADMRTNSDDAFGEYYERESYEDAQEAQGSLDRTSRKVRNFLSGVGMGGYHPHFDVEDTADYLADTIGKELDDIFEGSNDAFSDFRNGYDPSSAYQLNRLKRARNQLQNLKDDVNRALTHLRGPLDEVNQKLDQAVQLIRRKAQG